MSKRGSTNQNSLSHCHFERRQTLTHLGVECVPTLVASPGGTSLLSQARMGDGTRLHCRLPRSLWACGGGCGGVGRQRGVRPACSLWRVLCNSLEGFWSATCLSPCLLPSPSLPPSQQSIIITPESTATIDHHSPHPSTLRCAPSDAPWAAPCPNPTPQCPLSHQPRAARHAPGE